MVVLHMEFTTVEGYSIPFPPEYEMDDPRPIQEIMEVQGPIASLNMEYPLIAQPVMHRHVKAIGFQQLNPSQLLHTLAGLAVEQFKSIV